MKLVINLLLMAFCAFSFTMACIYLLLTIKGLIGLWAARRELRRLTQKK